MTDEQGEEFRPFLMVHEAGEWWQHRIETNTQPMNLDSLRRSRDHANLNATWLVVLYESEDAKPVIVKEFVDPFSRGPNPRTAAHDWAKENGVAGAREVLDAKARKAEQERLEREEAARVRAEEQAELNQRRYY